MKKVCVLMLLVFMVFISPLDSKAVVTKGQIQFYEDIERPIQPPKGGDDVKQPVVPVKHSNVNKDSLVKDLNKNKQSLLQTNDTVNYSASLLGSLLFLYAIYKIRRKV